MGIKAKYNLILTWCFLPSWFNFPLKTCTCGSMFETTSAPGDMIISDFSNIQTVNFSSVVRITDLTMDTITYNTELRYFYSCAYLLGCLINNIHLDVSASCIAIKDNKRSFTSISLLPTSSIFFNLFFSCYKDPFTTVIENGGSQNVRCKLIAFHFIEQQNETVST
ncbi:LOW QUALITY PROTEIN: zona pellucida-like domain-containing protein 1 [Anableps anableps]